MWENYITILLNGPHNFVIFIFLWLIPVSFDTYHNSTAVRAADEPNLEDSQLQVETSAAAEVH